MSDLNFDPHVFASRRQHPVAADYTQEGWTSNGVGFDDFSRMNVHNRSGRHKKWTPAFAASPKKLRRVLLERGRLYISRGHPLSDWQTINAAATKRALSPELFQNCPDHKRGEHEAHVTAVKRAGGYLELQAAIAYRAWLLGQNSIMVGESLGGMSPTTVRKNLHRLSEVARDLGYETFPRHHTYNRKRKKGTHRPTAFDVAAVDLWKNGARCIKDIAERLGYVRGRGAGRVKMALVRAGLHQPWFCRRPRP
jgi:hypothetical protein